MDFLDKIKGFLLSPVETFGETKEDSLGDALIYFLPLLVIFAVLSGVVSFFTLSAVSSMMGQFMPFGMLGGGGFTALTIINSIVSGFIGVFILGIIFHIFVYIMGGRNGIGLTIKAVIYGYTPNLLLGWIPIVNFIAMIWTLILYVIGIREYHEISTGKAALAVLLPLILIIIFVTVIFSALLLGMGGGPSSFMMP